ncbi:hypothetical protein ABG768_019956 [Culter alburnus]|uniref:Uncharacterized protein n=1 Tax=Culter alburnus TaxID=194366 RepID=A0AAW2AZ34_CULAL
MSSELFTMNDRQSVTDQILHLYVYELQLEITEQHLQAVQETLNWIFSAREMKEDGVKNQRTVSSLQKENCSLLEETLQQEPVEEEVLKIAVEEEAASVQETVTDQTSVEAEDASAMEKKTCSCFSWLWSCKR